MEENDGVVTIHTDGGCRGNPGPGAWAAVLTAGSKRKEIVGTEAHTTNNRMELLAAISGLEALNRPSRVKMVTDSEYLRRGITEWLPVWVQKNWKTSARKPVLNRDLWERLSALTGIHQVEWGWVRGHDGDVENERCDDLVNQALDGMGA
jgi:ribonuclease HI